MDRIEEIRDKIGQCDDNIIEQLVARMRCIQDIIEYKKEKGIPILQPEQEKKQEDNLKRKERSEPDHNIRRFCEWIQKLLTRELQSLRKTGFS